MESDKMNGKQKAVFSQRIDIEIIGSIQRSATKKGENTATAVERALSQYLASDFEITASERKNFEALLISDAIDSIANVLNVKVFGDILTKTRTIMAVCAGFSKLYPLRDSTKVAQLSLFEVLNDIQRYDTGAFKELMPDMKKFKKLNDMYLQISGK